MFKHKYISALCVVVFGTSLLVSSNFYTTKQVTQQVTVVHPPIIQEPPVSVIPTTKAHVLEEEYTTDDYEMLAHLLNGEVGADWISDSTIYYVGSVVLNRIADEDFPDTLSEVIYSDGQYACIYDGNFSKEPSERCYRIAKDLLRNGSVLPSNVVYQANFKQGSSVYIYQDTEYFCYK